MRGEGGLPKGRETETERVLTVGWRRRNEEKLAGMKKLEEREEEKRGKRRRKERERRSREERQRGQNEKKRMKKTLDNEKGIGRKR